MRDSCHSPQFLWESNLFMFPKAIRLEFNWLNCLAISSIAEAVLAMDGKVYAALHKLRAQRTFQIFNYQVHKYSEQSSCFSTQYAFPLLTQPCLNVPRPLLTQACWNHVREQLHMRAYFGFDTKCLIPRKRSVTCLKPQ